MDTVAAIYEAVLDPEAWPAALDRVALASGGHSAILSFDDGNQGMTLNSVFNRLSTSYDPARVAAYLGSYGAFELGAVERAFRIAGQRPLHAIVTDVDTLGDLDWLERQPAVLEAKRQFGFFRRAACILNPAEPWNDALLVQFRADLSAFPEGAFDRVQLIAPYLARAIASSRPLAILRLRYAMVFEALDRLAIGTAIVTGRSEIVLTNRAFDGLLQEGTSVLKDPTGRLRGFSDGVTDVLRDAVATTAAGGAQRIPVQGAKFSIPKVDGMSPVCFDIGPLGSVAGLSSSTGYAIVFVVDPDWRLVTDAEPLATAYGLTATEQEICRRILEGLTNTEIADLRGVSPNTVKFHVANVLSKTFSRNRTELAQRASAAVIPILED